MDGERADGLEVQVSGRGMHAKGRGMGPGGMNGLVVICFMLMAVTLVYVVLVYGRE